MYLTAILTANYNNGNCETVSYIDAQPFQTSCEHEDTYPIIAGVSSSPTIDPALIAAHGGGDYCVFERRDDCNSTVLGVEYVLQGSCVWSNAYTDSKLLVPTCSSTCTCHHAISRPHLSVYGPHLVMMSGLYT